MSDIKVGQVWQEKNALNGRRKATVLAVSRQQYSATLGFISGQVTVSCRIGATQQIISYPVERFQSVFALKRDLSV